MASVVDARCYLCGSPLSEPINRDHVPPQQFFAPEIRRKGGCLEADHFALMGRYLGSKVAVGCASLYALTR